MISFDFFHFQEVLFMNSLMIDIVLALSAAATLVVVIFGIIRIVV